MANNHPPLIAAAQDHAGRRPKRNVAARAATPIASTASPTGEPAGLIGPCKRVQTIRPNREMRPDPLRHRLEPA